MATSLGIETLIEKRDSLILERDAYLHNLDTQIKEIESCIKLLDRNYVFNAVVETKYDDENPAYIKQSIEN